MPSASSKSEKSASTEATDPIKQAIVIVGHKIRNLEKRKIRLDSYKESIKTLTKDQVEAISKYDEVIQQLELSKEYIKQFTVISVESEKLKKKQAKKEAQEKYLSEVNKIKQVLLMQNVLQSMCTESVREDFLAGRNTAVQLTANDLKTLDDLYVEVSQKHSSEENALSSNSAEVIKANFLMQDQFQKAAEYFMAIIEGKAKEIVGSTGAKIKELITSIHNCGYFDRPRSGEVNSTQQMRENEAPEEEEGFRDKREIVSNVIVPSQIPSEAKLAPIPNAAPVQTIAPGQVLPGGQPSVVPNQQQIIAPNVPNIVPTPVSQVESNFFNAQGFKPPAPPSIAPPPNQNTRQINDVIQSVTGKFNFLQESELDLSEMNSTVPGNTPVAAPPIPGAPPSAIPTQTFTNQNFSGQPAGAPNFPPNYPPQPAAFQTFVPTFPAFVPPNASPVQNNTPNTTSSNPPVITPGNGPVSMPTNNSNKPNNIPNPMTLASTRNPNINFNQGQQPISNSYPNQPNIQNMSQPPSQHVFQHGSIAVGSVENTSNDTVRKESEIKEKQEKEKQDWSQTESTNWADDCVDPSEWNPPNPSQSDGTSNGNKFQSGRINRAGGRVPRSANGYQGNRPRPNRQGGYRDSQNIPGNGGGTNNYYQNQNGYQSRNDRNNEFQVVGNKGNSDLREGIFKERGDFSSRDREIRDNYGGGFKRGAPNRGPNPKGPMDRGDRQGQIQRPTPGGPRGQRNPNRQQPPGRNGSSFQRLQPNSVEKTTTK